MRKHQSLTGLNLREKASKVVHVVVNRVIYHKHHDPETLSDHAKQIGTSARQRLKLIAKGAAQEIHTSVANARSAGQQMKCKLQRDIAILTSRKLNQIANKIEQKANAINTNPHQISVSKSTSR
jgi:hypothetical protein